MELKPVKPTTKQEKLVAKEIIQWQYDFLFKELFKILKDDVVVNDNNTIIQALRSGLIFYQDGKFISSTGRFSNKLALSLEQIGAKYSKYQKSYLLKSSSLPTELLYEIDIIRANTVGRVFLLNKIFDNFIANIDININKLVIDEAINTILLDFQNKVQKTFDEKKIQTIGIEFDDFRSSEFAKNYVETMKYRIVGKAPEDVAKMRQTVGQMALQGKTIPTIAKYLQEEFNVEKRRALFLARNEIGISLSTYLEAKYKSEGITHFKWQTNLDGRERKLHKDLNGKICSFDNPPLIYEYKGKTQYGLPKETYNCRCNIIPIVDKDYLQRRKLKHSV